MKFLIAVIALTLPSTLRKSRNSSLVGAAEGGLQYLLGGISNLGGIADDVLLAKVQGIKSALPRVALTAGIKIGSEVLEENLQLFIEPAIRKLVLGTPYEAPTWEDMAYTTILTALTTGAIEGGNIAKSGTYNPSQNTPTIQPPGQTAPAGGLYGTGDSGNMGARSGIGPEWQAYIDYGVEGVLGAVEGGGKVDISGLDELLNNPQKLADALPEQLHRYFQDNGYNPQPLSNGRHAGQSFSEGGGYIIRWGGDRALEYHPGGLNHHGNAPYFRLSSGPTGKMWFDLSGNPLP